MPLVDVFIRLTVATVLGLLLGTERTLAGKKAGMRTYALVSLSSALFVVLSLLVTHQYIGRVNFDPMRTMAAIITGIGFIGAGLIVMRENALRGLTTAAGLWVSAGIGAASGFGLYEIAVFVSVLTILIFTAVWFVEFKMKRWWKRLCEPKDSNMTNNT